MVGEMSDKSAEKKKSKKSVVSEEELEKCGE